MSERKGIAIAGNILVDTVKNIDYYPEMGMLASISSQTRGVGGCVPNTAINLAKIDGGIPIFAAGLVGDDENGRYVISKLKEHGIDTKAVNVTDRAATSYSDVMSIPGGERTFFHAKGANALLSGKDIDISSLNCEILHIGYAMLLDGLDKPDSEYGTVMARVLNSAQKAGIKTSVDAVSNKNENYGEIMKASFKYCDYVIINEVECCAVWGLKGILDNGDPDVENIREAMKKSLSCGIREKITVHSKKAGFCLDKNGRFTVVPSLKIPKGEIKGSVGAGDSFCAAALYGIYRGFDDEKMLSFASAAAVCNLRAENATDGMLPAEEIEKICEEYERLEL